MPKARLRVGWRLAKEALMKILRPLLLAATILSISACASGPGPVAQVAASGVTETLLHYDEQVFVFLNSMGSPEWDGFWLLVTAKHPYVLLYCLLLYLFYRQLGWKVTLLIMILVAALITTTDQLSNLFKHLFERPRPCRKEDLKELIRFIAPRCGRYGFFSAHAANGMAFAVFVGHVLKHIYKHSLAIVLLLAFIVGYSRIYIGVHYPLDIAAGFAIGGLIGFLFYLLFLKWMRRVAPAVHRRLDVNGDSGACEATPRADACMN